MIELNGEGGNRLYLKTSLKLSYGFSVYVEPQAVYIQDYPAAVGSLVRMV